MDPPATAEQQTSSSNVESEQKDSGADGLVSEKPVTSGEVKSDEAARREENVGEKSMASKEEVS